MSDDENIFFNPFSYFTLADIYKYDIQIKEMFGKTIIKGEVYIWNYTIQKLAYDNFILLKQKVLEALGIKKRRYSIYR